MTDGNFVGGKSKYKYCPPTSFDFASQVWVPACNKLEQCHTYMSYSNRHSGTLLWQNLRDLIVNIHVLDK